MKNHFQPALFALALFATSLAASSASAQDDAEKAVEYYAEIELSGPPHRPENQVWQGDYLNIDVQMFARRTSDDKTRRITRRYDYEGTIQWPNGDIQRIRGKNARRVRVKVPHGIGFGDATVRIRFVDGPLNNQGAGPVTILVN